MDNLQSQERILLWMYEYAATQKIVPLIQRETRILFK